MFFVTFIFTGDVNVSGVLDLGFNNAEFERTCRYGKLGMILWISKYGILWESKERFSWVSFCLIDKEGANIKEIQGVNKWIITVLFWAVMSFKLMIIIKKLTWWNGCTLSEQHGVLSEQFDIMFPGNLEILIALKLYYRYV